MTEATAAPPTSEAPSAEPGADTSSAAPPVDVASVPDSAPAADVAAPDKAKSDPKDVATDRESAYGRELRKREAKLIERQRRFGESESAFKAREAKVEAGEKAHAAREAAIAERERLLEEDPLGYATKHKGYRDEDLARRFLGGKASEQELAHRKEQEREARDKALQSEIDSLKADRAAERKAVEDAQKAETDRAASTKVKADFASFVKTHASKYPAAAKAIESSAEDAIDDCNAIALQMMQSGAKPGTVTWSQILDRYNGKLLKLTGQAPAASQGATKTDEKPPQQDQLGDAGNTGTTAPTLTGKAASQRQTIAKADDPLLDVLDPEAGRRRTMRVIEEAEAAHRKAATTH